MKPLLSFLALCFLAACMQHAGPGESNLSAGPGNGSCVRAGCGGQLCVEASQGSNLVTACQMTDEVQCYQHHGTCQRLSTGGCGWNPSYHLQQCLVDPAAYFGPGATEGVVDGTRGGTAGIGAPVTSPGSASGLAR